MSNKPTYTLTARVLEPGFAVRLRDALVQWGADMRRENEELAAAGKPVHFCVVASKPSAKQEGK